MNESKSLFTVFNHQPVVLNTVSLKNSSKPCYNTEDKILIVDIKNSSNHDTVCCV